MKNFLVFFYCLLFICFTRNSNANNNVIGDANNNVIGDANNIDNFEQQKINNKLNTNSNITINNADDKNIEKNMINTQNSNDKNNFENIFNVNEEIIDINGIEEADINSGIINNTKNTKNIDNKAKDKIINEFREKLLNEQEIKRELKKNVTLTEEDLDILKRGGDNKKITLKEAVKEAMKPTEEELLIKEKENKIKEEQEKIKAEEKRLKDEENRIKKEEERIKKEEERIKKEEEKAEKRQQTEQEKQKRMEEFEKLKKDMEKLEESKKNLENENNTINKLKESILSIGANLKNITANNKTVSQIEIDEEPKEQKIEKKGIIDKIFNITDTGVSEEFLYSQSYKDLINNKTKINKSNTNKETDIPILNVEEKSIINFNTSDIPPEILTYKRSEENKHIPTIILNRDMQEIAKKAIVENNLSVLRGIVEQTRDPDFLIGKSASLLLFAVENQKYILARYLLYSGASINKTDDKLNNPLHAAIITKNYDIIELLINNGVDLNAQNIYGETPLMTAIMTNQDDIAILLLKNGVDVKLKNILGESALDLCGKYRKNKIKQYIKAIITEEKDDNN